MATLGGPASSVSVVTDGRKQQGGPALPVAVVTDGRAVEGDGADPVYVVTSGPVQGGPALPVVAAAASSRVKAGPAMPVYVVSGSLSSGSGVVTSGLLIEYRFDDGSGTTLTDYASGFNGTLGTGAADRPDWVAAGLDFVPANADVVINSTMPDTNVLGDITICVVAKIDTGAVFHEFVSKCLTAGATANPFDFRTNNAATPIIVNVRSNAGTKIWNGPATTIGAYRMYSVVAPADISTAATFYVGVAATTGVNGGGAGTGVPTGASANVRIGRRADGAIQMDGVIAYLLIYSRALNAGEIAQNYTVLQSLLAPRGIALP